MRFGLILILTASFALAQVRIYNPVGDGMANGAAAGALIRQGQANTAAAELMRAQAEAIRRQTEELKKARQAPQPISDEERQAQLEKRMEQARQLDRALQRVKARIPDFEVFTDGWRSGGHPRDSTAWHGPRRDGHGSRAEVAVSSGVQEREGRASHCKRRSELPAALILRCPHSTPIEVTENPVPRH
jgi:hypothetical protein